MKNKILFLALLLPLFSQAQIFTHADTLRGSITPERAWWDARHYDLHVAFDPDKRVISGWNTVTYEVLQKTGARLQIDLMEPLTIDSAVQDGHALTWQKDGNAYFIQLKSVQKTGDFKKISVYYHGSPIVASRPPWDGGIIWGKDERSRPWVSVACQGV
ncbi:MAG: M1 family peptidase, partial [Bacteroidetes bacterium]|nr:M1 family peptidase [Bacteroidota bacterium]